MRGSLKTAVIGFGAAADTLGADAKMTNWFGPACHAQVLAAHPAFDWQMVVDPSSEARNRARTRWGITNVYSSLEEIDDPETVECAVLATPPNARIDGLKALPNLRAVIVEKPIGSSIAESKRFLDLCETRGILVQVAYWRRAVPGYRNLAGGEINSLVGNPQAVFGLYGNGFLNNGSHLIDLMRFLFGDVVSARASGTQVPIDSGPVKNDFQMPFSIGFNGGFSAAVQPLDFSCYREVGLDIWGEKGRLSILQEGLGVYFYGRAENRGLEKEFEIDSGKIEVLDIPVHGCFHALYDNLASGLEGKEALVSSGSSALETEIAVHAIAADAISQGAA